MRLLEEMIIYIKLAQCNNRLKITGSRVVI